MFIVERYEGIIEDCQVVVEGYQVIIRRYQGVVDDGQAVVVIGLAQGTCAYWYLFCLALSCLLAFVRRFWRLVDECSQKEDAMDSKLTYSVVSPEGDEELFP